ncbi:MAG: S8 family serine peptidase, partial [Candidatus Omnitrophica bacterium]|nr:S8 family serine peptidase [Candidatus Omnitrophota bacterium]
MKVVKLEKKLFLISFVVLVSGLLCADRLLALSIDKIKINSSAKVLRRGEKAGAPLGVSVLAPGLRQDSARVSAVSKFVPGEFIVKLKKGKSLADIKSLNAHYGIGAVSRVFPDPKEKIAKLKDRLTKLNSEHGSWFWQMDKNSKEYKDYIAKINKEKDDLQGQIREQESLIAAARNSSKGTGSAGLENIYILNTPKNADILALVDKYKDNPAIEYAEPNYIVNMNPDRAHDNWYWQLDKNSRAYKEYSAKIREDKDRAKAVDSMALNKLDTLSNRVTQASLEGSTQTGLGNIINPIPAPVISTGIDLPPVPAGGTTPMGILSRDPYYSTINSWGQGYADMWGLKSIKADLTWDTTQGEGVIVAVVDTGVDYNHEDIKNNMWKDQSGNYGFDFANSEDNNGDGDYDDPDDVKDTDPMDDCGHGTHVAGTIAAEGNNNLGVIGIAPKAKIMAVKALDADGNGTLSDLAKAIVYAADNGANVINNSWGGVAKPAPRIIADAVNHAFGLDGSGKNCVVLAATGNDACDVSYYTPANVPGVISVGSVDHNDKRSYFSNYGFPTDVVAPGGSCDWEIVANSPSSGGFYAYCTGEKGPMLYMEYSKDAPTNTITIYLNKGPNGGHVQYTRYKDIEGDEVAGTGVLDTFSSTVQYHVPYAVNIGGPGDERLILFLAENTASKEFSFDSLVMFGDTYEEKQIAGNLINRNDTGRDILSLRAQGTDMYGDSIGIFNEKYYRSMGTSMACPHASGVAALIKASHPGFGWQDVAGALMASSDDVMDTGRDVETGFGRINAFKAVSQLPKPVLRIELSTLTYKFIKETHGNGDGYINPGETGQVSTSITNLWDPAPTAGVVVSSTNPSVHVVQPNINFTNLAKRESREFNFDMTIDSNAQPLSEIWFNFQISASGDFNGQEKHFVGFVVPNVIEPFPSMSGWPLPISYPPQSTLALPDAPLLVDLDKDGKSEIVVNEKNQLKAYRFDGSLMPGWPIDAGDIIMPRQSAGDLDGDGYPEIVFVAPDIDSDSSGHQVKVYAVRHDGSTLTGWPKVLGPDSTDILARSVPVLADVDNDGKLEVILLFTRVVTEHDSKAEVHIWKYNGSEVTGWPKEISIHKYCHCGLVVPPAVADLDGDGHLEIVVPLYDFWEGEGVDMHESNKVFAWRADGTVVSGWPVTFDNKEIQTIAAGDLDGNGKDEIVLNLLDVVSFSKSVITVLKGDGTAMAGWPTPEIDGHGFAYARSGFALGDINKDNKLEIVANMMSFENSGWGIIYAWSYDGNIINGWPRSYAPNLWGFWGSYMPVICDIDSDGQNEIVLTTGESSDAYYKGYYDSRLYAWHGDGSAVAFFPKESREWVLCNPSLGDIDGDGRAELVMASATEDEIHGVNWVGKLYALALPSKADSIEWGTVGYNAQRTSRYVRNNELSGIITDKIGHAMANVAINFTPSGRSISTGSSGIYSVRNLAGGTYTITPYKYGYAFIPSSRTITVNQTIIRGLDFSADPNHPPVLNA